MKPCRRSFDYLKLRRSWSNMKVCFPSYPRIQATPLRHSMTFNRCTVHCVQNPNTVWSCPNGPMTTFHIVLLIWPSWATFTMFIRRNCKNSKVGHSSEKWLPSRSRKQWVSWSPVIGSYSCTPDTIRLLLIFWPLWMCGNSNFRPTALWPCSSWCEIKAPMK